MWCGSHLVLFIFPIKSQGQVKRGVTCIVNNSNPYRKLELLPVPEAASGEV